MSVWFSLVTDTLFEVDSWMFSGLVKAIPSCAYAIMPLWDNWVNVALSCA
nr:hypothetical protein [Frischella perrara]